MGLPDTLKELKEFLSDKPEAGFLAISLFANATLFIFYVRARDAHVRALEKLLPLATRLSDILTSAISKAKNRGYSSSNSPPPYNPSTPSALTRTEPK